MSQTLYILKKRQLQLDITLRDRESQDTASPFLFSKLDQNWPMTIEHANR